MKPGLKKKKLGGWTFSIGEKGDFEKHKQDPEKMREEVEKRGENSDIKAGWSPPDTHVSLPATHVSLPATESSPRAKSQKTQGKLLSFHEIDFPWSVFNENLFILCKKTFWKQKKSKVYISFENQVKIKDFLFFCLLKSAQKLWRPSPEGPPPKIVWNCQKSCWEWSHHP